ncbi:MAG: hypothetical protein IJ341_12935 [Bacteroidales bacterium]|nr:hypothetical protein [Bacteroidales bacterium]
MRTLINGRYHEVDFHKTRSGKIYMTVEDQPIEQLVVFRTELYNGELLVVTEDEEGERYSWNIERD